MPLEPSAAHAPHYGMPINLYNGQKSSEQYRVHGAVGPVSPTGQTGHGGPVQTGQTGSGALVAYPSTSEPIVSVPLVLADFSWMNSS